MKKFTEYLLTGILAVSLAACGAVTAATTNTDGSVLATLVSASQTDETLAVTATPAPAAEDAAAALAEKSLPDEVTDDASYDAASAIRISLEGNAITADGAGVSIEGSVVTVTEAGTYLFSGTLDDGQIVVDTDAKETVKLVLDGVDIRNSSSAAIYVADAEKVVILLAEGSQNYLSDGENYVYAVPEDEEPNATIFSKADLVIAGTGALEVVGNFNDAVNSKDGLVVAGGDISVTAVDDGLRGKDYLILVSGSLTVDAQGDGLKSDNDEDASLGYVLIERGSLTIRAGGDGISAQTDVIVQDGELNIINGGGSGQVVDETTSAKGIKAGVNVTIDGGVFTLDSADDAIHSNTNVTINGGDFDVATGDDGIHADETLTINGGNLRVRQSYEGIESAVITINGGEIDIVSSDDGINVAGGADGSGAFGGAGDGRGQGGGPGMDFFGGTASSNYRLVINGGTITVNAEGDGLDSNGSIEMTGGTVLINGPTRAGNGALDYMTGFNVTGGFFVAVSSGGMDQTSNQGQPSVIVGLGQTQAAGTLIRVQNSAGEDVLTFTPSKSYQSLAFSSEELVDGETYTVFVDSNQVSTFTLAGAGTAAGTGGGMNFGQGRRPGGGGQP